MSTAAVRLSGESRSDAHNELSVMAFVADDVTRQTLIRIAADQKWREPVIETGGISAARRELSESASPALLIVDLSESSEPLADVNGLAEVCEAGTRVIALGTTNDVRLYRSLMDAGVADYMVKPVAAADFTRAIAHATSTGGKQDTAEGKRGRIHSVVGARGGVGASTVALNLAWILSQEQRQRVVLIDLDLHFGTVALSLDVDPGNGFRDVLHNPGRIDPLFLERAVIRVNDTLAILSTEEPLSGAGQWSAEAFIPMLAELGKLFDHIILDVPRVFAVQHPELIASATTTILVTDLSLSAMRDALRIKTLVRETAPQTRLKIMLNQYRPLGKSDMPAAEFERSIDDKISCQIPFDPKSVAQAAGAGKPMAAVAKKSKGAEALRGFSKDLVVAKAGKKRSSVLARLFKS
jgi:pilus assembly protein CpaE